MKKLNLVTVAIGALLLNRCLAMTDSTGFNRFCISASYGFASPTHFVNLYGPYTLEKQNNIHFTFGADMYFTHPHQTFCWFTGIRINIWSLTFLENIPKTTANGFLFDQYNYNRTYLFHSAHFFAGITALRKTGDRTAVTFALAAGPDFHMRWNADIYSSQKPDLSSPVTVQVLALSIGNKDRWIRAQLFGKIAFHYFFRNRNSFATGIESGWGPGDFARGEYVLAPGSSEESLGAIALRSGYAAASLSFTFGN